MQRIHVTIRPLNREDSVLYFPPEAFGPFRVLHQIGAGTLGPVFRAYEPAGDRLVAVKVFRLDLTPEQAAALVTALDAVVRARITHPNIAAPVAAGLDHGTAFLAQEYAVGDSLDVVVRDRGLLPVAEVVKLVESLADAIDHAAERGVHHGLLHLRDVILAPDAARMTGFGIGAALSSVGARLPTRPQYAAVDAPSDVYSLAAIAFEAATGKRVSADNLRDFEQEHGGALRGAFDVALTSSEGMGARSARAFATALQAAAGLKAGTASESAGLTHHAAGATPHTDDAEIVVPPFRPSAPASPVDDLDLRIDGTVDPMAHEPEDLVEHSLPAPFSTWAAPPAGIQMAEIEPAPARRRWPVIAAFLGVGVVAALSVGFFLNSARPTTVTEQEAGVKETVVDLPASVPDARAGDTGTPVPNASAAPSTDRGELRRDRPAPAPTPSRPASGAVRAAQTGRVLIRSTPADAEVLVNGKPRGKTPLALRDLALGSYTIRVARDGYAPEERAVQLTARRPTTSTTINLRSLSARGAFPSPGGASPDASPYRAGPGGLNVQSRPPGARVFVNNRLAGSTPIAIPGLSAGPATVRIEMDGYQPWTTTVSVSAGEQLRVAASLERQ